MYLKIFKFYRLFSANEAALLSRLQTSKRVRRTADDRCDTATDIGTSSDLSLPKLPHDPINSSDNEDLVDETELPKKTGPPRKSQRSRGDSEESDKESTSSRALQNHRRPSRKSSVNSTPTDDSDESSADTSNYKNEVINMIQTNVFK